MADEATEETRPGSTRALVALLAFVLGFATVPHRVCERDAVKWFAGDAAQTDALAAGVARWTSADLPLDGEWRFATYMMSAMGFGQVALDRADSRDASIARMETCLDALLSPRTSAFDARAWSNDAIESIASVGPADRGHAGYVGYAALALALHRYLRPSSRFVEREEAFITALARRIDASPTGLLETYPGQVFPTDNTAALAALALHARAIHALPATALVRGLDALHAHAIDPSTGLLFHELTADAQPRDAPRASGTALGSYFLSFADGPTSRALFRALQRGQYRTVLGFGGMMEYPPGRGDGRRDDMVSGPVVLGFGVSASGFAIGASRAHGDYDVFTALGATAHLFGAPRSDHGILTYVTGGPVGDAILFAMFTAPRVGRFS
jgi:hypothetical protein